MVLTSGTTHTMATLLGDLGVVATKVLEYVVDVAETIVGNPILLMTTGILFLGGAIGIYGRLLSKN